jgi:Tol biopolymer transport system component
MSKKVRTVFVILALLQIMAASPQGYTQTKSRILFESGNREAIFIIDSDGTNQTKLDIAAGRGWAPVRSRDGCRIVFWHETRNTDNKLIRTGIYVMNANGSSQKPLIDNVGAGTEQDLRSYFSPDGSRVVFVSVGPGLSSDIMVINSDGSGVRKLTDKIYAFDPSWSPDGSKILFGSSGQNPGIRVMNSDGTNLQNIGGGIHARWSPDGSRIAFMSAERGPADIFVMNSNGTNARALLKVPTDGTRRFLLPLPPSWSPDGSRIAFQTIGDDDAFLEVVNADGKDRTTLANHLFFDLSGGPSWSPDGSRIAFTRMPFATSEISKKGLTSHASLSCDIYTVGVDGSNLKQLTTTGRALNPTWSLPSKCQ